MCGRTPTIPMAIKNRPHGDLPSAAIGRTQSSPSRGRTSVIIRDPSTSPPTNRTRRRSGPCGRGDRRAESGPTAGDRAARRVPGRAPRAGRRAPGGPTAGTRTVPARGNRTPTIDPGGHSARASLGRVRAIVGARGGCRKAPGTSPCTAGRRRRRPRRSSPLVGAIARAPRRRTRDEEGRRGPAVSRGRRPGPGGACPAVTVGPPRGTRRAARPATGVTPPCCQSPRPTVVNIAEAVAIQRVRWRPLRVPQPCGRQEERPHGERHDQRGRDLLQAEVDQPGIQVGPAQVPQAGHGHGKGTIPGERRVDAARRPGSIPQPPRRLRRTSLRSARRTRRGPSPPPGPG